MKKKHPIFSGEYSRDMWEAINSAKTESDLKLALYFVCCRIQKLESRLRTPVDWVCPTCHRPDSEHSLECPPEFTPRN